MTGILQEDNISGRAHTNIMNSLLRVVVRRRSSPCMKKLKRRETKTLAEEEGKVLYLEGGRPVQLRGVDGVGWDVCDV